MPGSLFFQAAADTLARDLEPFVSRWAEILAQEGDREPPEVLGGIDHHLDTALTALADSLGQGPPSLIADHFRDAVKSFAFVGGWLASVGASPSFTLRYPVALGEALFERIEADADARRAWDELAAGLRSAMMETYCISLRKAGADAVQQVLEDCTPIVRLAGDIPTLIMVGSPRRDVLSDLCGRLLMEVARTGSERVAVDLTFSRDVRPDALELLADFAGHRKLIERQVLFVGLEEQAHASLIRALRPLANVDIVSSLSPR